MAKYARVEDGVVIEYREMEPTDIPAHKASIWLPVEEPAPVYSRFYQVASGPFQVIYPDKVAFEYTITDRPITQLHALVDQERDRRIAAGSSVTIGNTTFTAQTRDEIDFRNINGLVSKGILLLMQSDLTTTVPFRDADNNEQLLNAQAMVSMGEQVATKVSTIYQYAWYLKTLSPLPETYNSDQWWTWTVTPPTE
jgi:hypothetical protein